MPPFHSFFHSFYLSFVLSFFLSSKPPYNAKNGTNATTALQQAINDCGGLPGGGTALVPAGLHLQTASLFLKSNLTFRVEEGAVRILGSCYLVLPLESKKEPYVYSALAI